MSECPECGRVATLEIAGYDMAVVDEVGSAEYCVVSEDVEGLRIYVHGIAGPLERARAEWIDEN